VLDLAANLQGWRGITQERRRGEQGSSGACFAFGAVATATVTAGKAAKGSNDRTGRIRRKIRKGQGQRRYRSRVGRGTKTGNSRLPAGIASPLFFVRVAPRSVSAFKHTRRRRWRVSGDDCDQLFLTRSTQRREQATMTRTQQQDHAHGQHCNKQKRSKTLLLALLNRREEKTRGGRAKKTKHNRCSNHVRESGCSFRLFRPRFIPLIFLLLFNLVTCPICCSSLKRYVALCARVLERKSFYKWIRTLAGQCAGTSILPERAICSRTCAKRQRHCHRSCVYVNLKGLSSNSGYNAILQTLPYPSCHPQKTSLTLQRSKRQLRPSTNSNDKRRKNRPLSSLNRRKSHTNSESLFCYHRLFQILPSDCLVSLHALTRMLLTVDYVGSMNMMFPRLMMLPSHGPSFGTPPESED
jgi:hypothetical protein